MGVAPLAGAWIETSRLVYLVSWVGVAPLAGAWIETYIRFLQGFGSFDVAPLAGAWIETIL